VRQLNTTINWYIWKGEIFRVPLTTLTKNKKDGGWNLINIEAKSRALFFRRMRIQGKEEQSLTADWIKLWGVNETSENPPPRSKIPKTLNYLRIIQTDSAYIPEAGKDETKKIQKTALQYHGFNDKGVKEHSTNENNKILAKTQLEHNMGKPPHGTNL
jgi:hypothetical protein